jgi:hypothetical protein
MADEGKQFEVIIRPHNPLDIREEELEPILEELRQDGFNAQLYLRPLQGYGVTWWEVLTIWLLAPSRDALVGDAVNAVMAKIKGLYAARRKSKANSRKMSVTIRDEQGKLLGKFELEPDGTVHETPADPDNAGDRPPEIKQQSSDNGEQPE